MRKIILLLILLCIPFSLAHLAGGEDVEKEGFIVDFGYEPGTVKEKQRSTLAFNLLNADTEELIEPSRVWVRISDKEDIVFAGNLAPQAKHVAFSYTFPRSGSYEITARFFGGDELLVEHEFDLEVERKSKKGKSKGIYFVKLLVLIVIVGAIYWYVKKGKKKKH